MVPASNPWISIFISMMMDSQTEPLEVGYFSLIIENIPPSLV